ncbi:hypothetical protein AYO38_07025 [bacterium SCGC AG-212-C10]|nr:hypothetical protein AYO38_07025 [bacterium SCGC AG-212-C10]
MLASSGFQDLVCWQKSRELTRTIYQLTQRPPVARDFGFCGQIQRASTSVMSNIAEGFERGGRAEFTQFLVVSKASLAEVYSLLYVGLDAGYFSPQQFDDMEQQIEEIARIVGGLRASVARQRDNQKKGAKDSALGPQSSHLEPGGSP